MCFRHRPLILVAQISSLCFRFVFGHPSLEGDAGYTVEFGDYSHTSTFYLDPAAVLSGEQDNFELVVLGCEEYDEELPMFGLSNSGFVYSDLFTAGAPVVIAPSARLRLTCSDEWIVTVKRRTRWH